MEDRNDEFYMRRAIELALEAQEIDEAYYDSLRA